MTEAQLISKARNNNRSAIEQLYNSYQSSWFMICLRYNRNREDALDVLQNALIKVFSHLKKFDSNKGSFKSWSSKIIVNESLMFLRSKQNFYNTFELKEEMEVYDSGQSALDYLAAEELTKMIQKLPTGYRTVF
jgi:RNA polymerase sigma-70 factor (ECF subfamily)